MDCDRIHEWLDPWLAGELEPDRAAQFAAHLDSCAECSAVVATLGAADLSDDLVLRPVLAATSGRTCPRVQDVLAGDPQATPREREWASAHVEHCAACANVAGVLATLPQILPTLATADPGPDFTAEVLLATLPRPSLWSVFLTRARDHLARWPRRPGFAQELAFAVTVVLVLLTSLPGSPLGEAPRQALSIVRVAGIGAGSDAPGSAGDEGTVGHRLRLGLRARGERLGAGFDRLGDHVIGAGRGLVDGDLSEVEENAGHIGCDLRRLWEGVTEPALDPESVCS